MQTQVKIEDLITGTGNIAQRGALITAHYRGWLEDGTEFDCSYKNHQPFQTVLSNKRVIQGWILGIYPSHLKMTDSERLGCCNSRHPLDRMSSTF